MLLKSGNGLFLQTLHKLYRRSLVSNSSFTINELLQSSVLQLYFHQLTTSHRSSSGGGTGG